MAIVGASAGASSAAGLSNGTTGTGHVVLDNTPTLITPILGTPTSGTLTNCTMPVAATASGLTMTTARLLGRTTASSGALEEITVGTGLSLSAGALTATAGASALTFLSIVTASNSATVDIETTLNSTYDMYVIYAEDVIVQTDGANLAVRMKLSGSYDTGSNYDFAGSRIDASVGTFGGMAATAQALGWILSACDNAAGSASDFTMYIPNPSGTANKKRVFFTAAGVSTAGNLVSAYGSVRNSSTAALTGVRIYADTGNIVSGKFRLYGISNT